MEISNSVKEVVRNFSGIKSALPHGVLSESDAEDALNFVTRRGRLRKIWGTELYFNSGLGAGQILWLEYFRERWMAQHGDVVIREAAEGDKNFVITGGIRRAGRSGIHSDKWENRIYLSNGVENKYVEEPGEVEYHPAGEYLTLGLIPPGNGAKNWTGDGALQPDLVLTKVASPGSALADAAYGYVVTWWDANREIESLPNGAQVGEDGLWVSFAYAFANASALTFTSMTDNAVRVDITALKAAGYDLSRVTHFIVYRWTQADNATLKRVADPRDEVQEELLRIANNYYDDTTVEAELGAVLDESLSPPPSGLYYGGKGNPDTDLADIGPRFVKFFRDQLWLFGGRFPGTANGTKIQPDGVSARQVNFAAQDGIAYASQVNNHEYWIFDYDIGRSTGQKDTGIAKHRNTLMFFKEASSFYLDGTSPADYVVRELDTKRGVTVPGSLAETTKGPIGLGAEGFTLFDSVTGGRIISEELSDLVQRINLDQSDKIAAAFDPHEEKYECHVPLDDATYNTHVFSYDLKLGTFSLTKKAGGAAAYGVSSSKKVVALLGDAQNGRLYDSGNYAATTFNGQTVHGHWRSKAFDFGRPGELKSLQKIEIAVRTTGADVNLAIDVIPDFGQQDAVSVDDLDANLRDDRWAASAQDAAGMKWDSGQWSKATKKKRLHFLVQAVAHNFTLVVRNRDVNADSAAFEIEEIVLEAALLEGDEDD